MTVLLSIKPEFATRIFSGEKRFEFRRSLFKRPVNRVVVYASAPVSMVIGEFEVEELLYEKLGPLWHKTHEHAGISEEHFYGYFSQCESGYAIKVCNPQSYPEPRPLREVYDSRPPQSFAYLAD